MTLNDVLETLRTHESELRRLGVSHAAVFGSVARSEAREDSDIDVLVELDPDQPMGIFEYARAEDLRQRDAPWRRRRGEPQDAQAAAPR
jgi:predicted nucleotidyltransferase